MLDQFFLSLIFLANDNLMYFKAKSDEFLEVQQILKIYELASGQVINYDKSTIAFGRRMLDSIKSILAAIFQMYVVSTHEKCFGVLSNISKNKQVSLSYIKDKVYKALQGWKGRLFSKAGKEVWIKSIARAILAYTLSCFKLPLGLFRELNQILVNF